MNQTYVDYLLESKEIFSTICKRLNRLCKDYNFTKGVEMGKRINSCLLDKDLQRSGKDRCYIKFIDERPERGCTCTIWFGDDDENDNFCKKITLIQTWMISEVEFDKENWKHKPLDIAKKHYKIMTQK